MTTRISMMLLVLLLSVGRSEATDDDAPWYVPGGHFGASYEQSSGRWRLLPLDGEDVEVRASADCGSEPPIPAGLWLVVPESNGDVNLLAPSTTELPSDHGGVVALRACGDPRNGVAALRAPRSLIDWLVERAGAIHVAP